MQKTDRVVYGTPLMQSSGKALSAFILAFTAKEKRIEYLEESMGHFYVLKTDVEFCIKQHIIHYKKKDGNGEIREENPAAYESSKKIELLKLIAKIDSDMCRWRASLAKSKTVCE